MMKVLRLLPHFIFVTTLTVSVLADPSKRIYRDDRMTETTEIKNHLRVKNHSRLLKEKKYKKSKGNYSYESKGKGKGKKKYKYIKTKSGKYLYKAKGKGKKYEYKYKGKGKGNRSMEPSTAPSMEPSHSILIGRSEETAVPTIDPYPFCDKPNRTNVGDGWCDEDLDVPQCGWDGGDCPVKYPSCEIPRNSTAFGDGNCDSIFNTTECGFDDGDCEPDCSGANNGYCEIEYNFAACSFDGGDCETFNSLYPNCNVSAPWYVGDGICDSKEFYNTSECGYDGGDCLTENKIATNSTNSTLSLSRNLLEEMLNYFYPVPDDEVLEWQK